MRQTTEPERAIIAVLRKERRRKAKERARRRYDKKEMIVCSAKVRRADAIEFKRICDEEKTTKHAAIKAYIERAVDEKALRFW